MKYICMLLIMVGPIVATPLTAGAVAPPAPPVVTDESVSNAALLQQIEQLLLLVQALQQQVAARERTEDVTRTVPATTPSAPLGRFEVAVESPNGGETLLVDDGLDAVVWRVDPVFAGCSYDVSLQSRSGVQVPIAQGTIVHHHPERSEIRNDSVYNSAGVRANQLPPLKGVV